MSSDPADLLARFTPAAGPDAAELMFRMGRASAPTRLQWKLAVLGLMVTNAAAVGWIAMRPDPSLPAPEVVTVVIPVPVVEPVPSYPTADPPGVGVIRVFTDPDHWPALEPIAGIAPPGPPLTPLAARRGDLD
jgi:hypothetical protein